VADQETKRDSSSRVQIIVALIGLAGVIATALISNWDKIFPKKSDQPTSPVTTSSTPGTGTPAKKSERPVHSNGPLVIRGTYSCDLDAGVEVNAGADMGVARTKADFQWEIVDNVRRFVTPANGAAFFVVGARDFESVRWSEMERFPYSTERIRADSNNSNQIPRGTVVAYKTNEGRLGKFIVDEYGYNLTIRWRTYD
jgi:hypothetical protein